jgi:hypothetical protein
MSIFQRSTKVRDLQLAKAIFPVVFEQDVPEQMLREGCNCCIRMRPAGSSGLFSSYWGEKSTGLSLKVRSIPCLLNKVSYVKTYVRALGSIPVLVNFAKSFLASPGREILRDQPNFQFLSMSNVPEVSDGVVVHDLIAARIAIAHIELRDWQVHNQNGVESLGVFIESERSWSRGARAAKIAVESSRSEGSAHFGARFVGERVRTEEQTFERLKMIVRVLTHF